jgi:hypothetical protein
VRTERIARIAPGGGRPSHPVSSGGRTERIFKFWVTESWAHTIGWIVSVWKTVGSVHRIRHTPLAVYLDPVGVEKWLVIRKVALNPTRCSKDDQATSSVEYSVS